MAVDPKIHVDGNTVVASGVLCIPRTSTVTIVPIPINEQSIKLKIVFQTNALLPRGVRSDAAGNIVTVTLTNADAHEGVSFLEPMPFAWVGTQDRKLRLLASAQLLGQRDTAVRLFTYTITADGAADV